MHLLVWGCLCVIVCNCITSWICVTTTTVPWLQRSPPHCPFIVAFTPSLPSSLTSDNHRSVLCLCDSVIREHYINGVMQCVTFEIHHFTQHHALEIHPDCSGINACVCVCVCVCVKSLQLFLTLWPHGLAHQAPLSMGFSRQEYWSGLPCPPPGDLPHPGIKPKSFTFPALAGGFFTTSATWEALGISGSFLFITELYSMAWMNVLWFI